MARPEMEAPGPAAGVAGQAQGEHNTAILSEAEARRKEKDDAGLIARAALVGLELRKLADGRWLASRWNLSKEFDGAADVDRLLAQMGLR